MTPGRSLPRPPWGAVLAGLTGLVLVLGTLPLGDPDTLWHILLGQRLAQTWDFVGPAPRPGLLSGDYVYTQWLPELVAAAGYAVWGLPGVAVLAAFARLAFVAWLYRTARREAGPLASLVVLVLTLGATLGALSARPQLVGVLLLGVVATAWRATALDGRPRWWLVPVMWIWGASHGTWIVGVAVGALALALHAMGRQFHSLLDVTLAYPDGVPTFWQFLCGRGTRVVMRVRQLPIPVAFCDGDYERDPEFRAALHDWLHALWAEKDREIDRLLRV